MRALVLSVACALLAAAACPAGTAREARQADSGGAEFHIAGSLSRDGGALLYNGRPIEIPPDRAASLMPYQIVATAPPLVTCVSADLTPITLAPLAPGARYAGALPMLVRPPLVALYCLPESADVTLAPLLLLDLRGGELARRDSAELLWPCCASGNYLAHPAAAYIVQGPRPGEPGSGDLVFPYGGQPHFEALALADGKALWAMDLPAAGAVAGVELWAVGSRNLLVSLQYDYELFEFFTISREAGAAVSVARLAGKPGWRVVYPGPTDEPAAAHLSDELFTLLVVSAHKGWQDWSFDLLSGQVRQASAAPPAEALREDNALPVGGSGSPERAQPPFPQQLLPTAAADQPWSIPALCDDAGRVLVVGDEVMWLAAGQ